MNYTSRFGSSFGRTAYPSVMLMQLNKPRLRGKRRGRIQPFSDEESSTIPARRQGRIANKAKKTATAAAVLVASFLIINSPGSVQAAPSSPNTEFLQIRHISQLGTKSFAESTFHDRSGNTDRDGNRINPFRRTGDVNIGAMNEKSNQLSFVAPSNPTQSFLQDVKQRDKLSKEATPSLSKRGENIYADTSNTSTRTFNVPASFTSNLANAWDPGRRSVWFQRKAVIITSIFLAIFIVLIIGCTVFLRDKRDDELDEEYDVSDEAALQRMRDEREMRLGSRGEKKSKRRKKKDEDKAGGDGTTTAIAASKWARLPTRKIRLRKKKSTGSSSAQDDDSRASIDRNDNFNRTSTLLTGADTQSHNPASESSQQVSPRTHTSDGQIPDEPPPLPPTIEEDGSAPATSSTTGDSSPGSNQNAVRTRLNAADIDYADAEEERMRLSDALPPAYIPSQNRGQGVGGSNAIPSSSSNVLHPSANRHLAGQSEEALVAAHGDSKRAMHTEAEGMAADSDVQMSTDEDLSTAMPTSSLGLEGHIATDDKNVLSRMRDAASRPDSTPHYIASAPGSSSLSNTLASAPVFSEEDEINQQLALSAGGSGSQIPSTIQNAEASSILPAPPAPHIQSTFSQFDLPYATDRTNPSSTIAGPSRASEKAKEAAEEERQAAALLASRPDDARMLPQYEPDGPNLQPSAPEWDDGTNVGENVPSVPSVPSAPSAPSAPPPPSSPSSEDGHVV